MNSANSGSISSSGDEEYDSRPHHTLLPPTFLNNHPSQFGSISHPLLSSSSSSSHYHHHPHPSLFDLSSTYLHALSQPNSSNPNSFLHLDTATSSSSHPPRSQPDCTHPSGVNVNINVTSSPQTTTNISQCLLGPQAGLATDNARSQDAILLEPGRTINNVGRNSKKRTRASRRAPTTVLTTDTSNFRAMVQEFTGIPAPPFSASSSYSRRLDLLTGSSSLRSSSHLDTTNGPFYPLRPSPQKVNHHNHHQNPLLLSSSSSPYNNMVDAITSTTTTNNNNNSSSNNNNPINYQQQLPPDLGIPYHHNPQNIMLSMQNHPTLAFNPPPTPLHPFGQAGFSAKLPSIEDLGMSHGQVNNNANFVASGISVPLRSVNDDGGGTRDVSLRSLDGGGSCKLNFAVASASTSLNRENSTLPNNNNNNNPTTRGEGTVDSWICSSD
ncbi:myosin-G heavy chain-like [Vigna radiata var. radiata]|uniref:Myosin-G heavy chain-like n=1 Tax=Vigna radiata var. radiata TaxID=3916 RepID=A0A1S3UCK7_VIGRR|nr:myosin-G heavy chain-like [Vigna radiata var. radiata]